MVVPSLLMYNFAAQGVGLVNSGRPNNLLLWCSLGDSSMPDELLFLTRALPLS